MAEGAETREADRDRLQRLERLTTQVKSRADQALRTQMATTPQQPAGLRIVLGIILLLAAAFAVWQRSDVVAIVTGLVGLWLLLNLEQRLLARGKQSSETVNDLTESTAEQAEMDELQNALVHIKLPNQAIRLSQADWQAATDALRQQERLADAAARQLQAKVEAWKAYDNAFKTYQARVQAHAGGQRRLVRPAPKVRRLLPDCGAPELESPEALPAELERAQAWQAEAARLERAEARLRDQQNRIQAALNLLRDACTAMIEVTDVEAEPDAEETAAALEKQDEPRAGLASLELRLQLLEQRLAELAAVAEPVMAGIFEQREHLAALRQEREQALHQAVGICGSRSAYEQAAASLAEWTPEGLEAELAQRQSALGALEAQEQTAREQLGAATSALAQWETTVSTDTAWALSEASAMRSELAKKWAVLTLAQALVREAREQFESDRQPAVLAAAGTMLAS